jgi:hypothetical protein
VIGAGPESGVSLGKFKDGYNWSAGREVQADIPLFKHTYVTVNAG